MGNLRLWSVISNWIRLVETGHIEAIINFYILFIKFYKFYVTGVIMINNLKNKDNNQENLINKTRNFNRIMKNKLI